MSNYKTLEESEGFRSDMEELGDIRFVDEAIASALFEISKDPERFDVVPTFTKLRLATTRRFSRLGIEIPPLEIWFEIVDEDRIMLLGLTRADQE